MLNNEGLTDLIEAWKTGRPIECEGGNVLVLQDLGGFTIYAPNIAPRLFGTLEKVAEAQRYLLSVNAA